MVNLAENDSGISEIVGALILILIVVIAAAGLAVIVSNAEKQQAEVQAHQAAISNEKFSIVSILPTYDINGKLTSINMSVQNLNIDDSYVALLDVNNVLANNITSNGLKYNYQNQLVIPGFSNQTIRVDMNDFTDTMDLDQNSPITIELVSQYGNSFSRTIKPPNAVAKFSVETENVGNAQRDYVLLDASDSNSDSNQIVMYTWTISNKDNHSTDIGTPKIITTSGKITRFDPPRDDSSGFGVYGYGINLSVTDNMGLTGNSKELYLPPDENFNPPVSLIILDKINDGVNETIVAQLLDADGRGIPNAVINFITSIGNFYMNPMSNVTNSTGIAISNASKVWDSHGSNIVNGSITVTYSKNNRLSQTILIP